MVHQLSPRLIPRDVVTQWNSTYDMMIMATAYAKVIDDITADKDLRLRPLELSHTEWDIMIH